MLITLVPELQQIQREELINYVNETSVELVAQAKAKNSQEGPRCGSEWWH